MSTNHVWVIQWTIVQLSPKPQVSESRSSTKCVVVTIVVMTLSRKPCIIIIIYISVCLLVYSVCYHSVKSQDWISFTILSWFITICILCHWLLHPDPNYLFLANPRSPDYHHFICYQTVSSTGLRRVWPIRLQRVCRISCSTGIWHVTLPQPFITDDFRPPDTNDSSQTAVDKGL